MAMLEKHRIEIYQAMVGLVSEEAAEAMVSQFPARDVEEPVTRSDLAVTRGEFRSEFATLRTEMADLRTELRGEMADLRSELRGEMADLRTDMAELRTELRGEIADLRTEMHQELHDLGDRLTNRMITVAGVGLAAITGLLALFS
jgi:hypothetical protein